MSWYPGKFTRGRPIIPYGPGMQYANEAAVIAALPVGSVVYDMAETVEANRMKRIRYVAELNGPDMIVIPAIPSGNCGSDSLRILTVQRDISAGYTTGSVIFRLRRSASTVFGLYTAAAALYAQVFNIDGTVFANNPVLGFSSILHDGKYHEISVSFGSSLAVLVDGVTAFNFSLSGWTGNTYTEVQIYDQSSDFRPMQVAGVRQTWAGGYDFYPCTESSGFIIGNQNNPERPATISDATAHAKSCVPIVLGG